jgi:hypothetical protein
MRRAYFIVLGAALALYLATLAPGVLWQDSGMAQVRVLHRDLVGENGLALAHPLYYVFAIAFQALPFAESAFRCEIWTGIPGAEKKDSGLSNFSQGLCGSFRRDDVDADP